MKNKAYFVTGTDTGVGKTVVSSGLLRAFVNAGFHAAGMKPIASGSLPKGFFAGQQIAIWEDILALDIADRQALALDQRSLYRFELPASPHFAAEAAGIEISPQRLVSAVAVQQKLFDILLIEGAGGIRVPLNYSGYDIRDFIFDLACPVILVVGLRLGCINHALMTIESLAKRNIPVAAWVANAGVDRDYKLVSQTVTTLEQLSGLSCAAVLPDFAFDNDFNPCGFKEYCEALELRVSVASNALQSMVASLVG